MSAEALKELEAKLERDTLKSHRKLTELWPMISKNEVNDSEREWLIEAEKLIEGFRETRKLFGSSVSPRPSLHNSVLCTYSAAF
jgi:hypothetical protein